MTNYLVPQEMASQLEAVLQAGGFSGEPLDTEKGKGVVLPGRVNDADLLNYLKQQGFEPALVEETEIEGVLRLTLQDAPTDDMPRPLARRVGEWEGSLREAGLTILEEELRGLCAEIAYRVPHGHPLPPQDDGEHAISVYVWSSPAEDAVPGSALERVPETIWGTPVDLREAPFPASGQGQAIMDGDYAVAELVDGRHLYIHHDLVHWGRAREREILRGIARRAAAMVRAHRGPGWREQARAYLGIIEARRRQAFAQAAGARFRVRGQQIRQQLEEEVQRAEEWRTRLSQSYHQVHLLQREVAIAEQAMENPTDEALAEFDRIRKMHLISDVEADEHKVTLHTGIVTCRDPRGRKLVHELGRYRIELFYDGRVIFHNLDRQVLGYQAPHVAGNGVACWGTAADGIADGLGSGRYADVAALCISFLESVNPGDPWGAHIVQWPRYPAARYGEGPAAEAREPEEAE